MVRVFEADHRRVSIAADLRDEKIDVKPGCRKAACNRVPEAHAVVALDEHRASRRLSADTLTDPVQGPNLRVDFAIWSGNAARRGTPSARPPVSRASVAAASSPSHSPRASARRDTAYTSALLRRSTGGTSSNPARLAASSTVGKDDHRFACLRRGSATCPHEIVRGDRRWAALDDVRAPAAPAECAGRRSVRFGPVARFGRWV